MGNFLIGRSLMTMWTVHVIHGNTIEQKKRIWRNCFHVNAAEAPMNGDPYHGGQAAGNIVRRAMDGTQRIYMIYLTPYLTTQGPNLAPTVRGFHMFDSYGTRNDMFGWGYLPRVWEMKLTRFPITGRTSSTTLPYSVTLRDVRPLTDGGYILKARVENPDFITVSQVNINNAWASSGIKFYIPSKLATATFNTQWRRVDKLLFTALAKRSQDFDHNTKVSMQSQQLLEYLHDAFEWHAETGRTIEQKLFQVGAFVPRANIINVQTMVLTLKSRFNHVHSFITQDWGLPIYPLRDRRKASETYLIELQTAAATMNPSFKLVTDEITNVLNNSGPFAHQAQCVPIMAKFQQLAGKLGAFAFGKYPCQPMYLNTLI